MAQLKQRDNTDPNSGPYSETELPVIRCFWHVKNVKDIFYKNKQFSEKVSVPVLNIAWAGNIFQSPPTWELAE